MLYTEILFILSMQIVEYTNTHISPLHVWFCKQPLSGCVFCADSVTDYFCFLFLNKLKSLIVQLGYLHKIRSNIGLLIPLL